MVSYESARWVGPGAVLFDARWNDRLISQCANMCSLIFSKRTFYYNISLYMEYYSWFVCLFVTINNKMPCECKIAAEGFIKSDWMVYPVNIDVILNTRFHCRLWCDFACQSMTKRRTLIIQIKTVDRIVTETLKQVLQVTGRGSKSHSNWALRPIRKSCPGHLIRPSFTLGAGHYSKYHWCQCILAVP